MSSVNLPEFSSKFEDLVDIVCAGANYGPEPLLSAKYEQLRLWMMTHYPPLQGLLSTKLNPKHRSSSELPQDALERLFQPNTLEALLATDDGSMIERIMETRSAIEELSSHVVPVE